MLKVKDLIITTRKTVFKK